MGYGRVASRRQVLQAATGSLAMVLAGRAALAADPATGPWVIELFTSQGCSSCPAADRNLEQLARRPDIVALSYHVDYWDHIGWKDPFASAANTRRQHTYAKSLRQRYVYTPEMVFHGVAHDSGRDMARIVAMLEEVRRRKLPRVQPSLVRTASKGMQVNLPAGSVDSPADIWLVTYDAEHSTKVTRGENSGTTLTNRNVVRSCELLAGWKGTAGTWTIEPERIGAGRGVAVLVQSEGCGTMLGAAQLAA
jgi:hypothetical protein